MKKIMAMIAVFVATSTGIGFAAELSSRYFYSGNGTINISNAKNGSSFKGAYRLPDGSYDDAALKAIHRAFGAVYGDPISTISTRLIEFYDYLEDKLNPGARITIASGFRSPAYNMKLRESGRMAAKASLHQYGMAADLKIEGVSSERVWNFIKELGFGGAGYYHGGLVHVDVGPARFWDETTSGVWTDASDDNKVITLVADQDIYLPAETVTLRFTRMTAFPIGVASELTIEEKTKGGEWKRAGKFRPTFPAGNKDSCVECSGIGEMLGIKGSLPEDLSPGRYRIRAIFCDKGWEDMPSDIVTADFEIRDGR